VLIVGAHFVLTTKHDLRKIALLTKYLLILVLDLAINHQLLIRLVSLGLELVNGAS